MIATTPSLGRLGLATCSSCTAAKICDTAAPEKARTIALTTNGIQIAVDSATPAQPTKPASAQSRNRFSRMPVRSE